MEADWTDYSKEKPPQAGVYEWRMPSATVDGMAVIVAAHMRKRGAGHTDVISPVFDYWDGYRVYVPTGLQWRSTDGHSELKPHSVKLIGVDGLDFCECIYCGKKPTLVACQGASGGGVIVGASPHRYNSWWISCCSWGGSPHLTDPREIERTRIAAFTNACTR
jgi:hypothetical protein